MRKANERRMMASNMSMDQFVNRTVGPPVRRAKNKLIVPPSSGFPPATHPQNNILKYPNNPQVRDYQQQIVMSCVCENTLVCLPTGLGKTHIAAILIANFINWFPHKKAVFLAPTRPLVRQQVSALRHLQQMVPEELILEVSGQLAANKREQLYENSRVIFGTPQTIENDIRAQRLNKSQIVLLIFDECHRSVGESSYAKIVRLMGDMEVGFRIVGLSATPGHQRQRVQSVISNLNLVKLMYRDDRDPQVKRYLNLKQIHELQIRNTDMITEVVQMLNSFSTMSTGLLIRLQLINPWLVRNGIKTTSLFLIREEFNQRVGNLGSKEKDLGFSALKISRKCVNQRGFQTFKRYFFSALRNPVPPALKQQSSNISFSNKQDEQQETISRLTAQQTLSMLSKQNNSVGSLIEKTRNLPRKFQQKMVASDKYRRLYQMFHCRTQRTRIHPKLQKLIEVLLNFFRSSQGNQGKAIVFTNLRATAKQIQEYLKTVPEVRSELFFGQSKTVFKDSEDSTSVMYLRQSEQLRIIEMFKKGEINTLISTSIGEEGLDIGEVDCIVCYDGGHSPIRAIQRRGRTGRKRAGAVYFLLMEGKEWQDYKNGLKQENKMRNMLTNQLNKFQYYSYNSALFQEKSDIVVEFFDNQLRPERIGEEKKTKVKKEKQKKGDGVATKKGKGKKGKEVDEDIEIHPTTIADLLNKYQMNQDHENAINTSFQWQEGITPEKYLPIEQQQEESQIIEQGQISENDQDYCFRDSFREYYGVPSEREEVSQSVKESKGQESLMIILSSKEEQQGVQEVKNEQHIQENIQNLFSKVQLEIDEGQQNIVSSQQRIRQVEEQIDDVHNESSSSDEYYQQFKKYKASKQTQLEGQALKQQEVHEASVTATVWDSDVDSMSSDQFLGILDQLQKRRHFQNLIDSDSQP